MKTKNNHSKNSLEGYPIYPVNEDLFSNNKEEREIDPEDITKTKEPDAGDAIKIDNEKKFTDDISGSDLDVPGSELDDQQESVGSEDEENNYYSLGDEEDNGLEENNE
jgi:hypothetical protein